MANDYQEQILSKLKEDQKRDVEQISSWKGQIQHYDKVVRERAEVIKLLDKPNRDQ